MLATLAFLTFAMTEIGFYYMLRSLVICITLLIFISCHPTPGPDKAVAGAILGAGWGAGAGAVIGNQLNQTPQGAAVGAGFGFVSGGVQGLGLDQAEVSELAQQRELEALRVQVASNQRSLLSVQGQLDNREQALSHAAEGAQVFFDEDSAELRSGASGQLERLAESIKANPFYGQIEIHGHSDEIGNPQKNNRLGEARARTVATFLVNQGLSLDKMRVLNHGSNRPAASNTSEAGRQLNRRVEIVLLK